ncbi:YjcZ family sporulation protein [Lysinibacillus sp. FSL M8-0216]|nr:MULTISPECIES: YjcZ family sporulation protein [Lysinibacillus]MED4077791.1 YjcZ family sporulation protein [Lysinibacillus fusiformis]MED4671594.1 YjcZ family sporulation protein [Lysinibacillus fusiformis]
MLIVVLFILLNIVGASFIC